MPTQLRRISFYADKSLVELLESESTRTGAPISELVRRAIRLSAFADAQTKIERRVLSPALVIPGRDASR